jgi:cytochrome c biogenesis protein CcmG/thiol:disulfide interchange protein DsbE
MNRIMSKLFVPLAIFLVIVAVLGYSFRLGDHHDLPSMMIDRPFPVFTATLLKEPDRTASPVDLQGEVTLVNVWATWCPSCLVEHPELVRIVREEGVRLVGVNYNDDRTRALAWLDRHSDPYAFHIVDDEGKLAIELGVYGAPETYVVDAAGTIRYRHVGAVNRKVWDDILGPMIQSLSGS